MGKQTGRRSWRRKLLWAAGIGGGVLIALAVAAYILAQRFEPMLREQTAQYLRKRFGGELDWTRFRVRLSLGSPLRVLLEKGKGAIVRVEVAGLVLRHRGRTDIAPLVVMRQLSFEADLSEVLQQPAHIRRVVIDGLNLTIPPKGERPKFSASEKPIQVEPPDKTDLTQQEAEAKASVIVDQVFADGTKLRILPRNPEKDPLEFDIYQLRLKAAGNGLPFQYTAILQNALPPGRINSTGSFGPWKADEPGDTPLHGEYVFRDADLSVFKGIAGTLSSTGSFHGELNAITADGETDVPNFSLDSSGNPMPLHTRFHAFIDGTNGNTMLQPVEATLNKSRFTAYGSITRNPADPARSIRFNLEMKQARLEDLLLLTVKGDKPILKGAINLTSVFDLQPKKGELAERLLLDGNFELLDAQFTSPDVQEKIDTLSRRGQGKPGQRAIANVPSDFVGKFRLENGLFAVRELEFDVPGALVQLDGTYRFGSEALDFRGKLRLQARLSKTMSGWKRILLTPVDPFFAKEGYGTVLNIKVTGTRASPEFGLDRGNDRK